MKKETKLGKTPDKESEYGRRTSVALYRDGVRGQIIWDCEATEPVEEEGGDAEPVGTFPDSNAGEGEKE